MAQGPSQLSPHFPGGREGPAGARQCPQLRRGLSAMAPGVAKRTRTLAFCCFWVGLFCAASGLILHGLT